MQFFAKIVKYRETERGTDLIVEIPGLKVGEKINRRNQGNKGVDAELRVNDGRTITVEQRKKIFATIRDIADFIGDGPEYLKDHLKYDYCASTGEEMFSLSNCSIKTARDFISHIIDFVLKWDIPLTDSAIGRTEDIDRYLYSCIVHRKCCITGAPGADIHHCTGSRIGMGSNRRKINHDGLELISLSREWHNKVHLKGEEEIFRENKIYGIILKRETLEYLGLNADDVS